MHHTKACEEDYKNYQRNLAAFEARWPNYCRRCGSTGELVGDYDRDTGFQDIEPCPDCLEEGICPKCKSPTHVMNEEGYAWCFECGWIESIKDDDLPPPEFECYCYEEATW